MKAEVAVLVESETGPENEENCQEQKGTLYVFLVKILRRHNSKCMCSNRVAKYVSLKLITPNRRNI